MTEHKQWGENLNRAFQDCSGLTGAIAAWTSRREAFRYLGYGKNTPAAEDGKLMESCIQELCTKLSPRFFAREYPLSFTEEGELVFSCFRVKSRELGRNLKDCRSVILFAATLGAGVDFLIRRYAVLDMSRAAAMQAASAAMIEAYCNLENCRLEEEYRKRGMALCPRFSPGYGDFPLAFQKEFAAALEFEKTAGITLTEGFLMMPSKSVTAVIGIKEGTKSTDMISGGKCQTCQKTDCIYREIQDSGRGMRWRE